MRSKVWLLKARCDEAGIFLDFDGTLSEIVDLPTDARPYEGAIDVLRALAARYRAVTIVSGRSARQLVDWLGPALDVWGVHGAERSEAGSSEVVSSPTAAPFAKLMQQVRADAEELVGALGLPGVIIEDKGVMVVLHYRATQDLSGAESALDEIATELTRRHRLWRGHSRLAFELRPPIELSKAHVVREVAREKRLRAAAFCGDDVVDLPGFDALDDLERDGAVAVRVAVRSDEAPPQLIQRADVVVDGPAGAVAFLAELL